ncbi:serine/threonine-protein kinase [Streptodolium elevatio]|uniref:non-specific serine/threonine protein kinase n=1 Tax=Streptodolium elevatio TaxID=3157996 RepID=A0ABV3DN79_9ACTN
MAGEVPEPPQPRYTVDAGGSQVLSRGADAVVYAATDNVTDSPVAMKVLHNDDPRAVAGFRQEADMLMRVQSPHVVAGLAQGEFDNGAPYVVMERLSGTDLRTHLSTAGGPLSLDETLRIGAGIAAGLSATHDAGIVHRDVKPENVMLGTDGSVKLVDLGIAAYQDPAVPDLNPNAGSIGYLAPERIPTSEQPPPRGEPATDLYGLGSVIYEMASGGKAFPGSDVVAVLTAQVHGDVQPLDQVADVPKDVADLVTGLMQPSPDARPQQAADVQQQLVAFAARETAADTAQDVTQIAALGMDGAHTALSAGRDAGSDVGRDQQGQGPGPGRESAAMQPGDAAATTPAPGPQDQTSGNQPDLGPDPPSAELSKEM